jgi:hypothetical protein
MGQCRHFLSSTRFELIEAFEVNSMEFENTIQFILSEIGQYFMAAIQYENKKVLSVTTKFFDIIYSIKHKLGKNRSFLVFF